MSQYSNIPNAERFALTADEEEYISKLTPLDKDKFLAKRHDKIQAEIDAENLARLNAENTNLGTNIENLSQSDSTTKQEEKITNEPFVLSRELLVKGVFRPNFNMVKNCFVNVKINRDNCACKIVGLQTVKPYKLAGVKRTNKNLNTNVALVLDVDGVRKPITGWQLNNVSSKTLKEEEFQTFKRNLDVTKDKFEKIKNKHKSIIKEFSRRLTNDEITAVIQKKLETNPKKETTTEVKMKLIRDRDLAMMKKDKVEAERLQRELEKIEDREFLERSKNMQNKNQREELCNLRRDASNNNK